MGHRSIVVFVGPSGRICCQVSSSIAPSDGPGKANLTGWLSEVGARSGPAVVLVTPRAGQDSAWQDESKLVIPI